MNLQEIQAEIENLPDNQIGRIRDSYHSFNELYEYRKVYNALLFNTWAKQNKYDVQKSIRHSDGELCFGGGWFIVVAQLPTGQVSNHYKMDDWDMFKVPELTMPIEYDGHTPEIALSRMIKFLSSDEV